jgi:hypothetical protein
MKHLVKHKHIKIKLLNDKYISLIYLGNYLLSIKFPKEKRGNIMSCLLHTKANEAS